MEPERDNRCAGVILADEWTGRPSEGRPYFGGTETAGFPDGIEEVFRDLFRDVVLVARALDDFMDRDLTLAAFFYPASSFLGGIHAGFLTTHRPWIFITNWNRGRISRNLVDSVVRQIDDRYDAVMPVVDGRCDPAFAAYSRKCLPAITHCLNSGSTDIHKCLERLRVKTIPGFRPEDPAGPDAAPIK